MHPKEKLHDYNRQTFADVPLRDDLLVEVGDESTGHLPVRRFVVHGQLDQDGHDHPPLAAEVGQHLLQREEDLHGVVVLEVLEDQRLNALPDILLWHLRDQRLKVGLRVL